MVELSRTQGILVVALAIVLGGCGGGGGGGQQEFTQQDAAAIEATSENISSIVEDNYDEANPQGSFQAIANDVRSMRNVTSVTATQTNMTVTYQDDLREIWSVGSEFRPPVGLQNVADQSGDTAVASEAVVGSRRAIVINTLQWWEPENFLLVGDALKQVCTSLRQSGFSDPVQLSGTEATISRFKGLNDYGVVVIITHGNAEDGSCWMQTGEAVTVANIVAYHNDWQAQAHCLVVMRSVSQFFVGAAKWAVTERFFNRYYRDAGRRFDGALFYNGACDGFANHAMYNALSEAGVACYLGWTKTQGVSAWSAAALLADMTDGDTIAQAYTDLPANLKADGSATLKYESGGTLQIVDPSYVPPETIWATGDVTGYVAECELQNDSSATVRVVIAPGTKLWNPESDEQNIVVIRELDMTVTPGQWMSASLYGCCINRHRGPPSQYRVLYISQYQRADLLALGAAIAREGTSDSVAQDAVWVLTDDDPPDYGNYDEVWNLFVAAGLSPYDYDAFSSTYSSSARSKGLKGLGNSLIPMDAGIHPADRRVKQR